MKPYPRSIKATLPFNAFLLIIGVQASGGTVGTKATPSRERRNGVPKSLAGRKR